MLDHPARRRQAGRRAPRSWPPAHARQVSWRHRTHSILTQEVFGEVATLMNSHHEATVAEGLAYVFLGAEWTGPALARAGRAAMDRRYRWLTPVAAEVVQLYREKPADRPRELARVIRQLRTFRDALAVAHRRQRTFRVVAIPATHARMARARWPVAPLHDVIDLADLVECSEGRLAWLADVASRQRRAPAGRLHLYTYRWVERPGRVPRLLEAPTPLLRGVLRRLLTEILNHVPPHPAAHGFVRGRSAVSHARTHVGTEVVISADLVHFFATLGAGRVYGLFRLMGYPEAVAHLLTGLTTTATPIAVLSTMPAGGSPDERHQLRGALRQVHVPQGAPTSPALANLACYALDARLHGYATAAGLTYTRYADDLAFSGPAVSAAPYLRGVARIVIEEGFRLNPTKTRVESHAQRQRVTGIVVNTRTGVPREDYDRLRAILHRARMQGPTTVNTTATDDLRSHLLGRIGWVEQLNPGRGARLRRDFDAVDWSR